MFWPLLGKTAKSRSNSSHSPQSCVHAIYAVHTDKHKCLPQMHPRAPSLINEDLRWGSVCVLRRICGEELHSFVISPLMLGGQLLTRAAREKRWKKCFNKFPSISTGLIFQGPIGSHTKHMKSNRHLNSDVIRVSQVIFVKTSPKHNLSFSAK